MVERLVQTMTAEQRQAPQTGRSQKRASGTEKVSLRQRVKEKRKSVYREAINEAAERVFAERGADRSRMSDIAGEAGISLGTLYGVIDGKDSLFLGIHTLRMREFMDCIRDASDAHNETLASHLAVLRLGGQFFLDHPDFLRICCRDGFSWATRLPAGGGSELWNEGASIPRDLFARGIAEGIYVDDDTEFLVRKMLALKQVDLSHWVDQGMVTPHEEVLDRLEDQFVRAFCTRNS
jgi:AcrR family transcriptional regulator